MANVNKKEKIIKEARAKWLTYKKNLIRLWAEFFSRNFPSQKKVPWHSLSTERKKKKKTCQEASPQKGYHSEVKEMPRVLQVKESKRFNHH